MRTRKRKIGFFSVIYGLAAVILSFGCITLALLNQNASPVLVRQPQAAMDQVQTMLDALCAGDYDSVSACLYGQPDLGLDQDPQDPVGKLFWDAVAGSFSYELEQEFHATDSGVALNIIVQAMDLNSVTQNLQERAQATMEARIAQAEDTDEIYDENNEYREDFVMDALYQAAQDALSQDAQFIRWNLTLNLIYENGQWWIMPEQSLLQAISAGILK